MCKPILVFSLGINQAEQYHSRRFMDMVDFVNMIDIVDMPHVALLALFGPDWARLAPFDAVEHYWPRLDPIGLFL